jgi:hypothetical protein
MDVRIILKIYAKEIVWEGVDWIHMAGANIKLLEIGISLVAGRLLAYEEGLASWS